MCPRRALWLLARGASGQEAGVLGLVNGACRASQGGKMLRLRGWHVHSMKLSWHRPASPQPQGSLPGAPALSRHLCQILPSGRGILGPCGRLGAECPACDLPVEVCSGLTVLVPDTCRLVSGTDRPQPIATHVNPQSSRRPGDPEPLLSTSFLQDPGSWTLTRPSRPQEVGSFFREHWTPDPHSTLST